MSSWEAHYIHKLKFDTIDFTAPEGASLDELISEAGSVVPDSATIVAFISPYNEYLPVGKPPPRYLPGPFKPTESADRSLVQGWKQDIFMIQTAAEPFGRCIALCVVEKLLQAYDRIDELVASGKTRVHSVPTEEDGPVVTLCAEKPGEGMDLVTLKQATVEVCREFSPSREMLVTYKVTGVQEYRFKPESK